LAAATSLQIQKTSPIFGMLPFSSAVIVVAPLYFHIRAFCAIHGYRPATKVLTNPMFVDYSPLKPIFREEG
jgi:hypothetical protein